MIDEYRVGIPSHGRPEVLAATTLPLLLAGGVAPERIRVFVSEETQREAYEDAISGVDGAKGVEVSAGHGLGMRVARDALLDGFPVGTPLVQVDDDIRRFVEVISAKTTVRLEDLDGMIREGFESAGEHLWATHPTKNPMFLWGSSEGATLRGKLRYAEGCIFGHVITGDPTERVSMDDKEDFERSLKFFLRDGEVVRMSRFGFYSNFYRQPGGMQDYRTVETIGAGALDLMLEYPELTRLVRKKKSGGAGFDVRLRNVAGTLPEGRSEREYPPGLAEHRRLLTEQYEAGEIPGWHG